MVDIRPITENELDAFVDLMDVAYLGDTNKDRRDHYRSINELDRSFGAFDGDQLVGTISAYSFDLTVPGNRTLPMGGTTVVAVRPTQLLTGLSFPHAYHRFDHQLFMGHLSQTCDCRFSSGAPDPRSSCFDRQVE